MRTKNAISQRSTVCKSYEVIMARGKHQLDLQDMKAFLYLLHRSYIQSDNPGVQRVPVSEVLRYLGHTSVSHMQKSLRNLGSVKIEIDYQEGDEQRSVSCHFLSYDVSRTSNSMLEYAFDPILLKFIFEPEIYGKINMSLFSQFKTSQGAKLYAIMTLFKNRFHRTWTVSVDEFRARMGVSPDQYIRFDNLRRQVIEKAVTEINRIAPFGIEVSNAVKNSLKSIQKSVDRLTSREAAKRAILCGAVTASFATGAMLPEILDLPARSQKGAAAEPQSRIFYDRSTGHTDFAVVAGNEVTIIRNLDINPPMFALNIDETIAMVAERAASDVDGIEAREVARGLQDTIEIQAAWKERYDQAASVELTIMSGEDAITVLNDGRHFDAVAVPRNSVEISNSRPSGFSLHEALVEDGLEYGNPEAAVLADLVEGKQSMSAEAAWEMVIGDSASKEVDADLEGYAAQMKL